MTAEQMVIDLTESGECRLGHAPLTLYFLQIKAQVHQCAVPSAVAHLIMELMYDAWMFSHIFLCDWSHIVMAEHRRVYQGLWSNPLKRCEPNTFLAKVPFCNASRSKLSVSIIESSGDCMARLILRHQRYREELRLELTCGGDLMVPDTSDIAFRGEIDFADAEFGLMRCECRSPRGKRIWATESGAMLNGCTPSVQPKAWLTHLEKLFPVGAESVQARFAKVQTDFRAFAVVKAPWRATM